MKKTFFLIITLLFAFNYAQANDKLHYTILKNPFAFSTFFEMLGQDHFEGRVVKNHIHVRSTYDLYDKHGEFECQAICRALSLGAIFSWAKEIDIYDKHDHKIGFIDGKTATTAHAKFHLHNKEGHLVAIAYLDYDNSGFTIVSPEHGEKTIGHFKRHFTHKESHNWEVVFYDIKHMDQRIVKIFSAFVVDHQDSF